MRLFTLVSAENHPGVRLTLAVGWLALMIAALPGCDALSSPEEEGNESGDRPWTRQFLVGNFIVNGTDVLTHESSTTNGYSVSDVCYSDLPSGALRTFSIRIYVPVHASPSYDSGTRNRGMVVFYGGGNQTPEIDLPKVTYIRTTTIQETEYGVFLVGGRYEGSTHITRGNFQQLRHDFELLYRHTETGEILDFERAAAIDIADC